MNKTKFITKVLHTKYAKDDPHGSLRMPVYDNVAFESKTAEELELAFQGRTSAHMYSRITNPTVEHFERQIQGVTGALGVIALSSGMAAISNTVIAIAGAGDNIVTSKHLFGNTYSLFANTLKSWGLETRYTDLTRPQQAAALIDGRTRAVFLETITNPQMEVADIKALSDIARQRGVLLVADTTLTPPYMFNAGDSGIDVEILSSTKYISGGATSVGGIIIDYGTYDWSKNDKLKDSARAYGPFAFIHKLRREVYRNLGACLSPHNAYLQGLGLETLTLRVDVSGRNAMRIAEYLEEFPVVKAVNYPGLRSSPFHAVAAKQFGEKFGALLTFDLAGKKQCFGFMNRLKIVRRATNLQDNRTLIIHPASTIFCEYPPALKEEMGVRETMLRLAVGIEDADDLIADIKQSLEGLV